MSIKEKNICKIFFCFKAAFSFCDGFPSSSRRLKTLKHILYFIVYSLFGGIFTVIYHFLLHFKITFTLKEDKSLIRIQSLIVGGFNLKLIL